MSKIIIFTKGMIQVLLFENTFKDYLGSKD